MGLLNDWIKCWLVCFMGKVVELGSVFIILDEKNILVDVCMGDVILKVYEDYIGKMVRNFDKWGYLFG